MQTMKYFQYSSNLSTSVILTKFKSQQKFYTYYKPWLDVKTKLFPKNYATKLSETSSTNLLEHFQAAFDDKKIRKFLNRRLYICFRHS